MDLSGIKLFNYLFNLIFFSFAGAILYALWSKIFRKDPVLKADKSLLWLSISVGISLFSTCWVYWFFENKPANDFALWVAFPSYLFSTLNSMTLLKALKYFDDPPGFLKDNALMDIFSWFGVGVIFTSAFLCFINNDPSIDTLYKSGGDLQQFSLKTGVPNLIYSTITVWLFCGFLLKKFEKPTDRHFWWLAIFFTLLFGTSQAFVLAPPTGDFMKIFSIVLLPATGSLQIVFYLLVILTWALKESAATKEVLAKITIEPKNEVDAAKPEKTIKMLRDRLFSIEKELKEKEKELERLKIQLVKYDPNSNKKIIPQKMKISTTSQSPEKIGKEDRVEVTLWINDEPIIVDFSGFNETLALIAFARSEKGLSISELQSAVYGDQKLPEGHKQSADLSKWKYDIQFKLLGEIIKQKPELIGKKLVLFDQSGIGISKLAVKTEFRKNNI